MNLSNIVIVLDHPDESRNIGAACRAMANNDISKLRIVGKKENYDIEHIHVLAIHAGEIFDKAEFYDSITEATADCSICAGTTRRRGKKRGKLLLPEEFADMANSISSADSSDEASKGDSACKIAVVFGNERTGLTDDQLDECNLGVTIPSSDNFGSLNLSHAVQIICYHLFRKNLEAKKGEYKGYTPLTLERIDIAVKSITDDMQKIGFFKMPGRSDMENFWRSILSRASLSEGEAKYLEKTFSKMAGLASKNNKS
ncbi:MAG: RNA methyltransferase [Treponema sp.]|nr:RNA methyltransferase [Treponema sp.]